jgi:hypothetical protein
MKTVLLSLLMFSLLLPATAGAAFYEWTDAGGVVHFTDSRKNIPAQYKEKARRVEVSDAPAMPAPATEAAPPKAPPASGVSAGGHDERWWRERFRALRAELKALQDARTAKEQQLVELHRKHTIFQRARDRQAENAMDAEIASDDARISEMLNRITALELAAAQAGVPVEWRQ